jgi:hypothetical protein
VFVDIERVFGKDAMIIKINGELWHIDEEQIYIKELRERPDLKITSPMTIANPYPSYPGISPALIVVEKLRIMEKQINIKGLTK